LPKISLISCKLPLGGLVLDARGNLYGTAAGGGHVAPRCPSSGCGLVFELAPTTSAGWTETILYSFMGTPDGSNPQAGVILDVQGNIYGTTGGGAYSAGTVFELSPPPPTSTSTSLTSSLNPSTAGESVMLTANVTPFGPSMPAGTVAFTSNGGTITGCSPVALVTGDAVCTTTSLGVGTDTIVATYSGDSNYAGSTSAPLLQVVNPAVLPQLQLSTSDNNVGITAGQAGSVTLMVSASAAVSSLVTFSCSGLPADATCSFSPASVTSLPATVTMTVSTTVEDARLWRRFGGWQILGLMLPGMLLLAPKRRHVRRAPRILAKRGLAAVFLFLTVGLSGCGSGSFQSYVVTVTASSPGAISGATGLVVTVTK
jgi:uncharacterized repeat protein (TIGR03803 family)